MVGRSSLLAASLLFSSGCDGDSNPLVGGTAGDGGSPPVGVGGAGGAADGGAGGSLPPPAPAADCPPDPIPSCTTGIDPAFEVWLDLPTALATPARVVDIEHDSVLVQTEPPAGTGEPLMLLKNGDVVTTMPVSDPHEPALRAVTFARDIIVLCGDLSCRVYHPVGDALRLLPDPEVPMPEASIAGSFAIGDYWTSSDAPVAFCVFGDGVVCLEGGAWTELAAGGDRLLTSGTNAPIEHVLAGENGRMGKLSRWPDTEAPPVWTEMDPLTTTPLRAASSWYAAGDDGTFITLGTDEATLCSTGRQDWYVQAGRLFSSGGEILFFSDPEVEMSGPCLRSGPPGLAYLASTDYMDGTTWGIRLATETQVFTRMTGFTE